MSSIVELIDIKKTYISGTTYHEALKGINIKLYQGDLVSIVGTSGAGKSTLMNIIGLLDNPTSGQYILNDQDVAHFNDDDRSEIRNRSIGFVFQHFFLLPKLTALNNVLLPTLYQRNSPPDIKDRAMKLLTRVGVDKFWHHKPNQLSGGQSQRVAIARALISEPTLILADEPTGALDTDTSKEVLNLFCELNAEDNVTVIIVTHDLSVAKQCHRILQIKDGLIYED